MRLFAGLLFSLLLFSGCYDKNYGIEFDDSLVPYFEQFAEEAAKRGVVFDNSEEKIEGYIQVITPEGGIAGLCNPDEHRNRSVILDAKVWHDADEKTREYIIFHELGHCFLDRPHIQDDPIRRNRTEACESIMFSGTYTKGGKSCLDIYVSENDEDRRKRLFDELFEK